MTRILNLLSHYKTPACEARGAEGTKGAKRRNNQLSKPKTIANSDPNSKPEHDAAGVTRATRHAKAKRKQRQCEGPSSQHVSNWLYKTLISLKGEGLREFENGT